MLQNLTIFVLKDRITSVVSTILGVDRIEMAGYSFELITGPMSCGKTEELLRRIRRCVIAKKRIKVIETKTMRNKMIKSKIKTYVKNLDAAIAAGDKAVATEKLNAAIAEISKATSKGIFHKNNAARKISNLTKAVNKMA